MSIDKILVEMLSGAKEHGVPGLIVLAIVIIFLKFSDRISRHRAHLQFSAFVIAVFLIWSFSLPSQLPYLEEQGQVASNEITEEKAQAVVSLIESAVRDKDVEKLLSVFDSNAKISIEKEDGKTKIFSKLDYKAYATLAFSLPSTYQTQKVKDSIQISNDGGLVTVTTLFFERATLGVISNNSLSNQITTIEMRNGVPVVTAVSAKILKSEIFKSPQKTI